MSTLRMTSDLRRQLILSAAKRCFARNGFAGTTTKSVAAAASISEGLLFKHFPSKAALYAEILAEECEADPDLVHLLGMEPSTGTLVELVRSMVRHFMEITDDLIGPIFTGSLDRAVAAGDASRIGGEPLNLFWFAHHTVLMVALARLPAVPCLSYGDTGGLERQLCEFILRGIGLNQTAIASHLDRELSATPAQSIAAESA